MAIDFLPICDLLFNFISVASYFCDLAFGVIATYTLYSQTHTIWFLFLLFALVLSLFVCQTCSVKWHIDEQTKLDKSCSWKNISIYLIHILQFGVLWRYFKLFTPISLQEVRQEMRNLCILRMIHGFVQGVTFVLIQGYLITAKPEIAQDVNYVSMGLSLFSICWALASFNKNIKQRNVHRLMLTWIGVIFQFIWRIGTLSSRLITLILYSVAFGYWIFLVTFLHWVCMCFWLIVSKKIFQNDQKTRLKNVLSSICLSYVFIFCYLNLENVNTKLRIFLYYLVIFSENCLLIIMWSYSVQTILDFTQEQIRNVLITVFSSFFIGLFFMLIYYKYFHLKKISMGRDAFQEENVIDNKTSLSDKDKHAVFNCTLNPALKRKKKIPSYVPPPPSDSGKILVDPKSDKMDHPFWKAPHNMNPMHNSSQLVHNPSQLMHNSSLDSHSIPSQTSPAAIQKKLQEKKMKQLEELQQIQHDIANGYIGGREANGYLGGHGGQPAHINFSTEPVPITKRFPPINIGYGDDKDSSGDQGDVDSVDEFDWRIRSQSRLWNKYQQPQHETPL